MQYKGILTSWLEYLELEKLHNLKIKARGLEDYKRITLNDRVKVEGNKLTIFVPGEVRKELSSNSQIYLGFPILEEYGKTYLPLFVIKKNVDGKIAKIEIDTESFSDFFVAKPVLVRALGFELQEIDELTKKKPLLSLLKDFLSCWRIETSDEETFGEVYRKFKNWLRDRIVKDAYRLKLMDQGDFVITTGKSQDFEYFEGQRIEHILADLAGNKKCKYSVLFPLPKEDSAAHKYLFGNQTVGFERYNESSFVPWFGTFHEFELSRGQALLLQKKAEGENLIAVQGPPGTGKTTVLMAVIASTLVERALSIAKKGKDFSTIILVVSTANKAVENAATEFEPPKTKEGEVGIPKGFEEVPIYARGNGFYFVGGKKENREKSLSRIDSFIELLNRNQFSDEKYEAVKRELLDLYSSLEERAKVLKCLINEVDEMQELKRSLGKIETSLKKVSQDLSGSSNFIDRNLYDLERELKRTKLWLEGLNSIGIDLKQLYLLTDGAFEKDLIRLKQFFQNRSLIDKILDFFLKRERKEAEKFWAKNRRVLNVLGVDFNFVCNHFSRILKKLEKLQAEARCFLSEKPDNVFLENLSVVEEVVDLRQKKLKLVRKIAEKKKQLEKVLEEENLDSQVSVDKLLTDQEDFLGFWKSLTVEANRRLFVLASKFLYLEALRQKSVVIDALNSFKLLMSGNDIGRAKEEIKKLGVEKFYRCVSLVYPVHFSSLHSAPYIFESIKNLLVEGSFKPIHILYVDEAAMALPHLSYPSVYFSEKVISVGDPLQLEPVVAVPEDEIKRFHKEFYKNDLMLINRYSPARTSTYHRTARCETGNYDDFGEACFLDAHRRCQKPIAELFKNVAGYKRLEIATPVLEAADLERLNKIVGSHLVFVDVPEGRSTEKNTNLIEAKVIIQLVDRLIEEAGYSPNEVIVITPFVKQEKLLQKELKDLLRSKKSKKIGTVKIGTVHKFQGQEALVVIMSTVVQKGDSTTFIDAKRNLLNVAISRAKHLFIMVGNSKRLRNTNYFAKALNFIKSNGKFIRINCDLQAEKIILPELLEKERKENHLM